jgi:hypothetical protein
MNEILSYAIPKDSSNIILCGYGYEDPATFMEADSYFSQSSASILGHKASIIMIDNSGEVQWRV